MKCFCIADEDTVRGFRLAGVPGRTVASPQEAAAALRNAAADRDLGLLLLGTSVADGIRDQVEAIRLACDHPAIAEIPAPGGAVSDRGGMLRNAYRTVGIPLMEEGIRS